MSNFIKTSLVVGLLSSSLYAANDGRFSNDKINQINDTSLQTHKSKETKQKQQVKKAAKKQKSKLDDEKAKNESLEKGFEYFKKKDYVNAYKVAISHTKDDPENINAWLLAGDSAFRLGDFDRAIAAFDCVLILDENNIHAHLESAKIYAIHGNKELLKLEIDALVQLDILDPQDKKDFKELLAKLNENTGTIYGSFDLGLFFDSNPFSQNDNLKSVYQSESGAGVIASVNAGYEYHFNDSYSINLDGGFYNKSYFNEENKYNGKYPDFRMFSVYVSPKRNFEDFSIGLNASYSYMFYIGKKFMHSPGIGISMSKSFANGMGVDFGVDYTKNLFLGDYKDVNSSDVSNDYYHASLFGSFKYIFGNNLFYSRAYLSRDRKTTDRSQGDIMTDYDGYGFMINYNRFFDNFYANIGYSLDFNKYKEGLAVYDNKRNDYINRVFAGYTYMLSRQISAALNVSYSKRFSNVDGTKTSDPLDYNYDQLNWQFSFRYNF